MRKNLLIIVLICLLWSCKSGAGEKVKGMIKVEGDDNISTFYICDHEVTQAEYSAVTGEDRINDFLLKEAECNNDELKYYQRIFVGKNKPVHLISWYDAVTYCNMLSIQHGLTPCYTIDKEHKDPDNKSSDDELKWTVTWDKSANGYRLPTENEWEWAAKGGKNSKGYKYSGSDNVDDVAWYEKNAEDGVGEDSPDYGIHNVKMKKPNELGIYDMSGNVAEWCWDWFILDPSNPEKDYTGLMACNWRFRSGRGGCFYHKEKNCRIRNRQSGNSPNDMGMEGEMGIRVVRSCK